MFKKATHKFTVSFSIINNDTGETLEPNDCLTGIAIKNNYTKDVFPLYVLTMSLTESTRQYIVQNNVLFAITISRYSVLDNSETNESTADSPDIDKIVSSEVLLPFDKPKVFINANTSDIDNTDDKENIENVKVSYQVTCIPQKYYYYNTTVLNNCYCDCNVNEIILNELAEVYPANDIYFQESTNTKRYDSVLIPPMNFVQSIKYLQNNFLVYENATSLFFDNSKMYIYDIYDSNRKFDNTMIISVVKPSDNSDKTIYQSTNIDEDDNIRVYLEDNPMLVSIRDVYKNEIGGTSVINSYDDNFNLVSRIYNTEKNNTTRYFWNSDRYSNFEPRSISSICQFSSLSKYNLDPSILNPATKILLQGSDFDDANGQYALLEKDVFYVTTDYKNFTNSVEISIGQI